MQMVSPLIGKRILVTRPKHQAGELSTRLVRSGAQVVELPMIEIRPPLSWQALDQAIKEFSKYDWVIFASANAVHSFVNRVQLIGPQTAADLVRLASVQVAAIGIKTARSIESCGMAVNFLPSQFAADQFVREFPKYPHLIGEKILWPRTNIGNDYILEKFAAAGAQIDLVSSYRTELPSNLDEISDKLSHLLDSGNLDLITFTSGQTVRNFVKILSESQGCSNSAEHTTFDQPVQEGDDDQRLFAKMLKNVTLVSIGPETSAAMKECLLPIGLEAVPHDIGGMVSSIEAYLRKRGND
jgi:uroporphyrinogen III methyltransferase/synthase